jgi:hypothetical protein
MTLTIVIDLEKENLHRYGQDEASSDYVAGALRRAADEIEGRGATVFPSEGAVTDVLARPVGRWRVEGSL